MEADLAALSDMVVIIVRAANYTESTLASKSHSEQRESLRQWVNTDEIFVLAEVVSIAMLAATAFLLRHRLVESSGTLR